jgi:hypothetical protein
VRQARDADWASEDLRLEEDVDLPQAKGPAGMAKTFGRFPIHPLGSCSELEYDLLLARDLTFLPPASHARLAGQLEEVRRMLSSPIVRVTADVRTRFDWRLELATANYSARTAEGLLI